MHLTVTKADTRIASSLEKVADPIGKSQVLSSLKREVPLKSKFLTVLALGICVSILCSVPLSAHHGNAAYDDTKQITLKGTVTQFVWANPHCVVLFDATDGGQVVHWMAETENPTTMTNMGWLKSSLKPGDAITIRVIAVKNGKPIGRIVWVETPSGQKLPGRLLPTVDKSEDDAKQ